MNHTPPIDDICFEYWDGLGCASLMVKDIHNQDASLQSILMESSGNLHLRHRILESVAFVVECGFWYELLVLLLVAPSFPSGSQLSKSE